MFMPLRLLAVALLFSSVEVFQGAFADEDYPIRPVAFTEVTIDGGLWASRIKTLRQQTEYPWNGRVQIEVQVSEAADLSGHQRRCPPMES